MNFNKGCIASTMEICETDNGILIKDIRDFSLSHTFDCGQCFRFHKTKDGYAGVAFGRLISFGQQGNTVSIEGITKDEFDKTWRTYLDLDRNYQLIKEALISDPLMSKAMEFGHGIRILKQEFFECLISFIISQQNNIPRIKKAVEEFARKFGKRIEAKGRDYYAFPDPKDVEHISRADLESIKIGYRDNYVIDAIRKVNNGEITFDMLNEMSYEQAKKELMTVKGIGEKVADCVLLYSLAKFEAFPSDTWIKKAMRIFYGVKDTKIREYSTSNYGDISGFAQQYIFYYARYCQDNKKVL